MSGGSLAGTILTQTAGIGQPDDANVAISSAIDIYVDNEKVGAIDSFNVNVSRVVTRVRELNSAAAGRTVAFAPGPEESSITVSGFLLYTAGKNAIFNRIVPGDSYAGDAPMISIGQQMKGFDIHEKYVNPATGSAYVVIYKDVWLTNYSKSQNINTAMIIENATMEVRGIESKPS